MVKKLFLILCISMSPLIAEDFDKKPEKETMTTTQKIVAGGAVVGSLVIFAMIVDPDFSKCESIAEGLLASANSIKAQVTQENIKKTSYGIAVARLAYSGVEFLRYYVYPTPEQELKRLEAERTKDVSLTDKLKARYPDLFVEEAKA